MGVNVVLDNKIWTPSSGLSCNFSTYSVKGDIANLSAVSSAITTGLNKAKTLTNRNPNTIRFNSLFIGDYPTVQDIGNDIGVFIIDGNLGGGRCFNTMLLGSLTDDSNNVLDLTQLQRTFMHEIEHFILDGMSPSHLKAHAVLECNASAHHLFYLYNDRKAVDQYPCVDADLKC